MTSVSTVSTGTTGTYEPYESATPSYDTDSASIAGIGASSAESVESYEGTGVSENRCPRDAPECVSANLARRARWRIMRPGGYGQAMGVAA